MGGGGCPKIVTSDVPTSELTIFLASPLINLQFRNGGGGAVCERNLHFDTCGNCKILQFLNCKLFF